MRGSAVSGQDVERRRASGTSRRVIAVAPSTIWLVTGIVVALVILTYIVAKAIDVAILVFIAIIFAEAIRPIVDRLARWHVPRPLAVLIVYLALVLLGLVLLFLLLQPVIAQSGQLQRDLPRLVSRAQQEIERLRAVIGNSAFLSQLVQMGQSQLGQVIGTLVPLLVAIPIFVLGALVGVVAIAAMAFFWLTGVESLRPFLLSLMPEARRARTDAVFALMGQRLGGYVRGVVFNMFVIGILSGAGDFILQVPYPVLLGLLAGITELLPYVGPWIGGGAAVLVALVSGGPTQGAEVAGLYIIIQQIEGHTLVPVVMNRAVHVNPFTVIVAVLVGASVLGIVGGVLAVPVAAMIHVLIAEVLGPEARRAAADMERPRPTAAGHGDHLDNGPGNGPGDRRAPDDAARGTAAAAAPVA